MTGALRVLVLAVLYALIGVAAVAFYTRFIAGRIPGATVTSWWRSPFHNAEVGGNSGSLHILGWAVDLSPDSDDVAQAAQDAGFPVVVREGNHLHAAWWRS